MRNPRSSQFFQDLMARYPEMYSGNINYNNIGRQEEPSLMSAPIQKTPIDFPENTKTGPSRPGGYVPTPKTPNNEPRLMSMPTPPPVNPSLIFTAGTVDYSFPAGGGYGNDGFDGSVYDIKVDSSGRYLIGGDFGNYYYNGSSYYSPYLIRLNPDGTVDTSFNTTYNNDCYGGGFNGTVYTIEIQPDGKILVGGGFSQYDNDGNCNNAYRIIRLNSDATRDLTFNTGDGFNDEVYDIELQPDGKILVAGYFTQFNNTDAYRIIRLNSNGSIDSSFVIGDTNVGFDNYVNVIKLQADGKIIAGGYFGSYASTYKNYITRINSDGTVDTSFHIGAGFNNEVSTIALQSDGKIIVGGYFNYYDNNDLFGGRIVRLNTDGSIDTLFGYGLNDTVTSITIQSDGKILVGGYMGEFYPTNYDTLTIDELVRFHSDCTLDYSFYYGELLDSAVWSIVELSDGKILIGGEFGDSDPSIYPLNYFGRLNNSILPYKYTYLMNDCDQPLNDSTVQYIVGSNVELNNNDAFSFTSTYNASVVKCGYISGGDYNNQNFYSNQVDYVLTEVYGSCDDARSANSKIAYTSDLMDLGEGYNLLVDNKYQIGDIIYVDMVFEFIGGQAFIKTAVVIDNLVPYNSNSYFTSPIIPYSPYETLESAVVSNGVHYVAIGCNEMETNYPLIHKLYYGNTSLLIPTGNNPCKELVDVFTFAPYYFISGGTNELNSVVEFETCDECLTKTGNSGLLDNTLYNNDFNNFVYTMLEQPDGKILVGGNFDTVNNIPTGSLVRLNTDGTLDETFNSVYCNQPIWSVETPFNTVTTRFIRWTITRRRSDADAVQASEFVVYANGEAVSWDGSVGVNNAGGDNPGGEVPQNLVDGDTETKWADLNFLVNGGENPDTTYGQSIIEIDNFNTITFDSYSWATANDFPERDAVSWTVEVSMDNENWTLISNVSNADITEDRYTYIDPIAPSQSYNTTGSIYFDGTPLCGLSGSTGVGVWDFGYNNLTFEWFQKFEGDVTTNSILFDYRNNDLRVYFSQGFINVVIDGDTYSFELISSIENVWCHIAITRYYDPIDDIYIWRVFQNGIEIGEFLYNYYIGDGDYLVIGNTQYFNYDYSGFNGYITNFRVNNGEAIYTSDFSVPTAPLDPNYNAGGGNTVLCLSVNNETYYIFDSCDDSIATNINNPGYYIFEGFNSYIRSIALDEFGRILVGGNFNYYNNQFAGKIIRLNSDGSIDNGFTFSTEFNGIVRAIALQSDGKIVVGGDFNYYYDYYCNHIVRLNIDGTPDDTFVTGDGFDGSVFTINIERERYNPFYNGDPVRLYVDTIYVGGWFDNYNNMESRGIAVLTEEGTLVDSKFGVGFNYGEGGTPRVNQIFRQSDGKLVIIGGADGGNLVDYQGTHIPRNLVRLYDNGNGQYLIDETLNVPPFYYGEGGFNNGNTLSVTQQSDGKLIIGGNFSNYQDNNNNYFNLNNIIRLNTNGTYDPTFSMGEGFNDQVNKVLLLSDGKLLTGGRYSDPYPTDYLTRLYIGNSYSLRNFTDCDGNNSYVYLPIDYTPVSSNGGGAFTATTIPYSPLSSDGLDLIYDNDCDDCNFNIELPLTFDINFLGLNYTTVYVGSNSYLTFGDGSNAHGFDTLPGSIPNETGLPGVYLSTRTVDGTCLDSTIWKLYTGLTDNGNTLIVRVEGNDDYDASYQDTNFVYNYKFYKDQSDYFDLIIEQNVYFCDDNSTGGVSNGIDETWITSFDTSSENSYRIGITTPPSPIKTDFGSTPAICGQVGTVVTGTPPPNKDLIGGSMFFDGTAGNVVTVDYNGAMDLDYDSWTIEWFQYYTSTDTCCKRVFDIGTFPNEHIGVSLENGSIVVWIERPSGYQFSYTLNDDIFNTWSHFAISSEDIGGNDRRIRIFQNGVELGSSQIINVDMNNFDGPTLLPLIIGGMGDGSSPFEGYITNFRWNKGTCYYTSNFSVPTSPLYVDGSELLLLATNEAGLIYDSSETQTISQNNVTWSTNTPFGSFTLSTVSDVTSYDSCDVCNSSVDYNVTLYVRDGINPNYVSYNTMTKSDLESVLLNGPIFTLKAPKTYEILNFNL